MTHLSQSMTHLSQLAIYLERTGIMFYPRQKKPKIMKKKKKRMSKRKKKTAMTATIPASTTTTTTTTQVPIIPMTTTSTTTSTTMLLPWLPHEVIFSNILPRLQVRSLLRFTCVSKLWYNTIHHDPNFIASHFTHAKSNPSLVTLVRLRRNSLRFMLHSEKEEEEEGEEEYMDLMSSHVWFIGDCNGLICSRTSTIIQIINPSTRELLLIRLQKQSWQAERVCVTGWSNGFGFDPLKNEYKVIQLHFDSKGYYECWVYTLGSNNLWRNITDTCGNDLSYYYPIKEYAICINGALFWRTKTIWTSGILSFDLHHEKFKYIPCPRVPHRSIISALQSTVYGLFELEARPCLVYCYRDNLTKDGVQLILYRLNDHHHLNVVHSWTRLGYSIRLPKMPDTRVSMSAIEIVAFHKQIYLQWLTADGDLKLYNVNSKVLIQNKLSDLGSPPGFLLINHVENLLSLKTFVPPSSDETEVRYVSSREGIHDSVTTTCTSCGQQRELQEIMCKRQLLNQRCLTCITDYKRWKLREDKRHTYISNGGCFTSPRWVSRS